MEITADNLTRLISLDLNIVKNKKVYMELSN